MKEKSIYRIFVIIAGMKIFVGKTRSDDTQSILWRHLRGTYKTTRGHFIRGSENKPQIMVLEEVHADFKIAYRHTIAFIRLFRDAGYQVLNSKGMIEDALDIHPMTQSILDTLKGISAEQYLEPAVETTLTESENVIEEFPFPRARRSESDNELATEKLTIRLPPSEKKQFTDLAEKTGVSQRQMLMLMMANQQYTNWYDVDWSSEEYVRPLLKSYRDEIEKLEKENEDLHRNLHEKSKAETGERKAREQSMRDGIRAYCNQLPFTLSKSELLDQGYYKSYLADTPEDQRHRYPDTEDFFVFFPEAILMGRGRYPARFIIGHDDHGSKVLLRYYPKTYYTGFSFTNEKFGLKGSRWFVRCEWAKDGAMDVVFALPQNIGQKDFTPKQDAHKTWDGQIDSLIEDARRLSEEDDSVFF